MKTRTLLLLAFGCGLAILLAGGLQLLRLAGDDEPPAPLAVGETALVGDMRVTVREAVEEGGTMLVRLTMIGVDDADGGSGFRLVVPGGTVTPVAPPAGDGELCGATAEVIETACALAFDTSRADGSARVLLYDRAGETQRWDLTAT